MMVAATATTTAVGRTAAMKSATTAEARITA